MNIFDLIRCIPIPVLLCCPGIRFLVDKWFCRHQIAFIIIQCHALDLVCINLIKQTKLSFKFLTGYIIFLNDIIIDCIGNLSDVQ